MEQLARAPKHLYRTRAALEAVRKGSDVLPNDAETLEKSIANRPEVNIAISSHLAGRCGSLARRPLLRVCVMDDTPSKQYHWRAHSEMRPMVTATGLPTTQRPGGYCSRTG